VNKQPATKRNTQYPISALLSDPYRLLLVAAILVYIWLFAGLAFEQHAGMRTHKADLGQMDQAIWNTSQGRFVEEVKDDFLSTRLTDHVEPIFLLIAPVLWLWDDVRALLLLQVMAVALGALPLYALALEKLDQLLPDRQRGHIWQREPLQQLTRPLALAVGLAWLLSPQLQSAVLTELHAIPFAAPLIVWAFWAVEKRKSRQFILAALLLASVKEEAALLSAGLSLWALWRNLRNTQYAIRNLRNSDRWQQHRFPKSSPWAITALNDRKGVCSAAMCWPRPAHRSGPGSAICPRLAGRITTSSLPSTVTSWNWGPRRATCPSSALTRLTWQAFCWNRT